MLVLSRRENEKVVFPNLGIQIDVVRVAGKVVRLGIDAPKDVSILRGELARQAAEAAAKQRPVRDDAASREASRQERHALRNRLNKAMLGLQVLQATIEAGHTEDSEALIYKIFQNLQELNAGLDTRAGLTGKEPRDEPPRRALIVDDNVNEAELLAQYLELNGYTAEVVENGREAIAWLQQHEHPDVILMDMNMPEMDGATAIHTIREDHGFDDVRLFGVSGLEQDEAGLQSGEGGVDCWFTKPVDARKLVAELRRQQQGTQVSA